jgi:hypothetical protein
MLKLNACYNRLAKAVLNQALLDLTDEKWMERERARVFFVTGYYIRWCDYADIVPEKIWQEAVRLSDDL